MALAGFSNRGVWTPVAVHRLSCPTAYVGILVPQWDQTHNPCVGRQIINHWLTIRKVSEPHSFFFYISEPYMWIMIDQILAGS